MPSVHGLAYPCGIISKGCWRPCPELESRAGFQPCCPSSSLQKLGREKQTAGKQQRKPRSVAQGSAKSRHGVVKASAREGGTARESGRNSSRRAGSSAQAARGLVPFLLLWPAPALASVPLEHIAHIHLVNSAHFPVAFIKIEPAMDAVLYLEQWLAKYFRFEKVLETLFAELQTEAQKLVSDDVARAYGRAVAEIQADQQRMMGGLVDRMQADMALMGSMMDGMDAQLHTVEAQIWSTIDQVYTFAGTLFGEFMQISPFAQFSASELTEGFATRLVSQVAAAEVWDLVLANGLMALGVGGVAAGFELWNGRRKAGAGPSLASSSGGGEGEQQETHMVEEPYLRVRRERVRRQIARESTRAAIFRLLDSGTMDVSRPLPLADGASGSEGLRHEVESLLARLLELGSQPVGHSGLVGAEEGGGREPGGESNGGGGEHHRAPWEEELEGSRIDGEWELTFVSGQGSRGAVLGRAEAALGRVPGVGVHHVRQRVAPQRHWGEGTLAVAERLAENTAEVSLGLLGTVQVAVSGKWEGGGHDPTSRVSFDVISARPVEVLGQKMGHNWPTVRVPVPPSLRRTAQWELAYIDDEVRVNRGQDGTLYLFRRKA